MRRYLYEAFCNEFPGLQESMDESLGQKATFENVDSINVKRLYPQWFNSILKNHTYDEFFITEHLYGVIKGKSHKVLVKHDLRVESKRSSFNSIFEDGLPIIDFLAGFENTEYFILTHYEDNVFDVLIFKALRDTSVAEILKKLKEISAAKVKSLMDF